MRRRLGIDALDVRKRNLYGEAPRNITHYRMTVKDNVLPELDRRARGDPNTGAARRDPTSTANEFESLALTPVKFGIAFTTVSMNQAGALVHIYTDGSVHLNHGGTEMGQGLMIKVAQIVAEELGVPLDRVQITPTSTAQVPNTVATASSGTDVNGEAARGMPRAEGAPRALP